MSFKTLHFKVSILSNIVFAIIFTSCTTPEERIREEMKSATEYFIKSNSDYHSDGSKVNIYNVSNNINYLADDSIREFAISYANSCIYANQDEYYEKIAEENKSKLLSLLNKTISKNKTGGIWVYHEINYKEYIYYRTYAGPYVKRTLYLFSENGDQILWSSKIHFHNDIFLNILDITNTHYDINAESKYKNKRNGLMAFVIFLSILLFILLIIWDNKRKEPIKRAQEEEKERVKKEREEAVLKAQREWQNILDERVQKYGNLTTKVDISHDKECYIYVYEESKVIFILGKKYDFQDIISCTIETHLLKKGTTTYKTTPDMGEMATEQLLWGMGKKYNVKSTTETYTTPDSYYYRVYIGVNSISEPQIWFDIMSSEKANRINNLINVIIKSK